MSIILSTQSPPDEELVRGGPSNIQGSAYRQKQSAMISSVQPIIEGMVPSSTSTNLVPASATNPLKTLDEEELKKLNAYEAKFNAALEAYTKTYHDYTEGLTGGSLWGAGVAGTCGGTPVQSTTAILSSCKTICEGKTGCKAIGYTTGSNACNLYSDCSTSKPQTNTTYMEYNTAKVEGHAATKNQLALLEVNLNTLADGMWAQQQKVNALDLKLQSRITERHSQLMVKNSSLEVARAKLDQLEQEGGTLVGQATNKLLEADSAYLRYGTFIAITVALGALSIRLLSR